MRILDSAAVPFDRRLLILLAAFLAALLPASDSHAVKECLPLSPLSKSEIRTHLVGHKLSGYSVAQKKYWTESLLLNGVTDFRNNKGKQSLGRWWLEGARLCFSYGSQTGKTCKTVHRPPKRCDTFKYALIDEAGELTSAIYRTDRFASSGSASSSTSELDRAIAREKAWNAKTRIGVQNALIWSGDYNGKLDGDFGRGTRKAIRSFQASLGQNQTGYLTKAQIRKLEQQRKAAVAAVGFEMVYDIETGIEIGIPKHLFPRRSADDVGMVYKAANGSAIEELSLISMRGHRSAARDLFNRLLRIDGVGPSAYSVFKDDWFVISDEHNGIGIYIATWFADNTVKGFMLTWPSSRRDVYQPIAAAMFNSFERIPGRVMDNARPARDPAANRPPRRSETAKLGTGKAPQSQARPRAQDDPPPTSNDTKSTGTGFVVSAKGQILTNAHVVDGCAAPVIAGKYPAKAVAVNDDVDLALLKVTGGRWDNIAKFSPAPARLNSDVTVVGYPLYGLLGGLNVTRGSVSSLTGLEGRLGEFQMSAAVQPGNSGGPVVDAFGAVVGVVRSKLDAIKVAESIGDIPQNINFAIRGETAKLFLLGSGVEFQVEDQDQRLAPADLADLASGFTVLIECR